MKKSNTKRTKEQILRAKLREQKRLEREISYRLEDLTKKYNDLHEEYHRQKNQFVIIQDRLGNKSRRLERAIERLNAIVKETGEYKNKYERTAMALQVILNKEHEPVQFETLDGFPLTMKYDEQNF